MTKTIPSAAITAFLVVLACGCGHVHPKVFKDIHGDARIYPDVLDGKPCILAFLSANDRRCDREYQPLWSLNNLGTTKVVGVLIYDSLSYVTQIQTLDWAQGYPVLLDPEKELARRYGVSRYPTYVFLAYDGDVIARARDLKDVEPWTSDPAWRERASPLPTEQIPAKGEDVQANLPPWRRF